MIFYEPNEYQKAILGIEHTYPDTSVCCIGGIMPFGDGVSKEKLVEAVKEVVRLTPTVRLRLDSSEGLYISEEAEVVEETELPLGQSNIDYAKELMREPIALINSPLYQFKYVKSQKGDFGFMKIHHILGDHAALLVFFREIEKIYFQRENGTYEEQKADMRYIESDFSKRDFAKSEAYFKERIEKYGEVMAGHRLHSTEAGVFEYELRQEESEKILSFCKDNSLKPESVFYAGLAVYLRKTTGVGKSVFGRVLMNRGRGEIDVFGLYANTLPVFMKAEGDFLSICKNAAEELAENTLNSSYPLNLMLEENGLKERCFNIAMSFISGGMMPRFKTAQPQKVFCGNIELPMRLHIMHKKKNMEINLEYAKEVCSYESARGFVKSLISVIISGISGGEPECLTDEDERAYRDLNSTEYIKADKTVSRLFSEYARQHGSETAIVFGGEKISFEEAENMANTIAHAVSGCKVVGIRMGRCKYLVPAMLGVLKAGGAYMSLAPNIIPPSECEMVLTLSELTAGDNCKEVAVDLLDYSKSEYMDFSEIGSPAYFMRTSGSSGAPKTVKISNASLYLRLKWMDDEYSLKRRILQKTNAGFDVSGWELLCGAFGGCCIMVRDGEEKDLAVICGYIDSFKIEMIHFVPSMLRLFLRYIKRGLFQAARHWTLRRQSFLRKTAVCRAL